MTAPEMTDLLDLRLQAAEAHQAGEMQQALDIYDQILQLAPESDDIWVNIAEIYAKSGQQPVAVQALHKALNINSANHLAWYNLALASFVLNNWEMAEQSIKTTIQLAPDMALAHFTAGNIYHMIGRHQEAVEAFRACLRLDETNAEAWSNLGVTFCDLEQRQEAIQAYLMALKHDIGLVSAHGNLALVLLQIGRYKEAISSAQRALAIDPDHTDTLNTMGAIYANRGEHEKAVEYFRHAIAVKPDFWKAHSNLLFCILHKDSTTLAEVQELHQEWYQLHGTKGIIEQSFKNNLDPDRRLRIGFVSGDFRSHPVGYFIFNTFSRLIAEKAFDIYVYANQYEEKDDFTLRFRNMTGENWRQIWNIPAEKVVETIKNDQIDVLFDLTGHNARHRLDIFGLRAAPVQVTWAGYMATTGVPQIDWLLCDNIQTPLSDQPYYNERLYNLPNSFICYTPPPDAPPLADEPPCIQNDYVTFACFNKPSKVTARAIRNWSQILCALPGSRLVMKFSGLGDNETVQFFRDQFTAHGVQPEQLQFEHNSPHAVLLGRYNGVDMALDPMPYTGSTTTLEAIWMGTPLVTLPGDIFPARHAASYLTSIGLPELIAQDEQDYVEKVIALARDPDRLRHYKKTLREQMRTSPMCNQDLFIPEFNKAVRFFWQDYCSRRQ